MLTKDYFFLQVSIVASEDSFLLTMSVIKLKTYLDTDPFISNVFYNVVGKDVSNKLYQIQELLLNNPDYTNCVFFSWESRTCEHLHT